MASHVTAWTPTEGAKRADWLMREIQASADVLGIPLASRAYPMYHQRVFQLIAEELDKALAEVPASAGPRPIPAGTELNFWEKSVPEGWTKVSDNADGTVRARSTNGHADPDDYSSLEIAARSEQSAGTVPWPGEGRQGHVLTQAGYVSLPLDDHMPDAAFDRARANVKAAMETLAAQEMVAKQRANTFERVAAMTDKAAEITDMPLGVSEAPKKRRGRPPGSKAKKAKRKAAKTVNIVPLGGPVPSPVAETVAAIVPEQSEATQ